MAATTETLHRKIVKDFDSHFDKKIYEERKTGANHFFNKVRLNVENLLSMYTPYSFLTANEKKRKKNLKEIVKDFCDTYFREVESRMKKALLEYRESKGISCAELFPMEEELEEGFRDNEHYKVWKSWIYYSGDITTMFLKSYIKEKVEEMDNIINEMLDLQLNKKSNIIELEKNRDFLERKLKKLRSMISEIDSVNMEMPEKLNLTVKELYRGEKFDSLYGDIVKVEAVISLIKMSVDKRFSEAEKSLKEEVRLRKLKKLGGIKGSKSDLVFRKKLDKHYIALGGEKIIYGNFKGIRLSKINDKSKQLSYLLSICEDDLNKLNVHAKAIKSRRDFLKVQLEKITSMNTEDRSKLDWFIERIDKNRNSRPINTDSLIEKMSELQKKASRVLEEDKFLENKLIRYIKGIITNNQELSLLLDREEKIKKSRADYKVEGHKGSIVEKVTFLKERLEEIQKLKDSKDHQSLNLIIERAGHLNTSATSLIREMENLKLRAVFVLMGLTPTERQSRGSTTGKVMKSMAMRAEQGNRNRSGQRQRF